MARGRYLPCQEQELRICSWIDCSWNKLELFEASTRLVYGQKGLLMFKETIAGQSKKQGETILYITVTIHHSDIYLCYKYFSHSSSFTL